MSVCLIPQIEIKICNVPLLFGSHPTISQGNDDLIVSDYSRVIKKKFTIMNNTV